MGWLVSKDLFIIFDRIVNGCGVGCGVECGVESVVGYGVESSVGCGCLWC